MPTLTYLQDEKGQTISKYSWGKTQDNNQAYGYISFSNSLLEEVYFQYKY